MSSPGSVTTIFLIDRFEHDAGLVRCPSCRKHIPASLAGKRGGTGRAMTNLGKFARRVLALRPGHARRDPVPTGRRPSEGQDDRAAARPGQEAPRGKTSCWRKPVSRRGAGRAEWYRPPVALHTGSCGGEFRRIPGVRGRGKSPRLSWKVLFCSGYDQEINPPCRARAKWRWPGWCLRARYREWSGDKGRLAAPSPVPAARCRRCAHCR